MSAPVAGQGEGAPRKAPHWTHTYDKWDGWQDPDEVAKKREEEEKRAKSYRDNHMACAHDRSAERKVMEMPIEEKIVACRDFRRKGNLFHKEGQYRRGALQYRQALIYYDFCFPDEDSQQQELDDIRHACLLNSAACFLACGELDQTLDCCYQALMTEPDNVKALYRRAVVYRMRDQFKEASADIGKALAQRPNDVMLRKESTVLKSKIASYRERRKAIGAQIFGKSQPGDRAHEDEAIPSENQGAQPLPGENGDDHDHDDLAGGAAEHDPSESFRTASGKELGRGSSYAVGEVGPGVSGNGDLEGPQRHDLLLPVRVDLSRLESMAGCAWPGVA
eukprot:g11023.t1